MLGWNLTRLLAKLERKEEIEKKIQWNLGIRDTHGTVQNCPEFGGGLISQVHIYVLNRPRD